MEAGGYLTDISSQIFGKYLGVEKSISYERVSNPRLHVNVAKPCCGRIPFDHRFFISSPSNRYIPLSLGDLTNFASATPPSVSLLKFAREL